MTESDGGLLGGVAWQLDGSAGRTVFLHAGTPGPAGVHEVALDGVVLRTDAADPTLVCSADVDRSAPNVLRKTLFGDRDVDDLVTVAPPTSRVGLDIAAFVLAASSATHVALSEPERALATMEAAVHAAEVGVHVGWPGWSAALHEAAAVVVAWTPPPGRLNERALDVTRRAGELGLDDVLRARLRRVATTWDRPSAAAGGAARPAAAPGRAQRSSDGALFAAQSTAEPAEVAFLPGALEPRVSIDLTALVGPDGEVWLRHTDGDEFEICVGEWGDRLVGCWVRAHSASGVPLAVVPLRAVGLDARATFLTTASAATSMVVEIVTDPTSVAPTPRLASFRAAVLHGQRAARLERLRRPADAAATWRRSGRAWGDAGDPVRMRAAAVRASEVGVPGTPPPALGPVVADFALPA